MNTEQIIAKGVEKHFDGQEVLFSVESLNIHFDGLLIHESDFITVEGKEGNFVKVGDVSFDNATANKVAAKVEEAVAETPIDLPVLEPETPQVETPIAEEIQVAEAEVVSATVVEEAPAPTKEVIAPETPVVTEEVPADNVSTAKGK